MDESELVGQPETDGILENGAKEEKEIPRMKLVELKMTDYMRKSLEKVARNEGFHDFDLVLDHGSGIGDGFVGIVLRATIKDVYSDKSLKVIVKIPPENETRRIEFKSMEMFEREVFAYNKILPEFVKFQLENRIKPEDGFFNFPKVYFAEHNEELDDSIIIMEDLTLGNYKMWSKFKPIDLEHAKLTVSSIGRLHAISFAFKHRKSAIFEEFKQLSDFFKERFNEERFFGFISIMLDKAIDTLKPEDIKAREKMENFKKEAQEFMRLMNAEENLEPYSVLIHGDCWINNFMFKYRVSGTLKFPLLIN